MTRNYLMMVDELTAGKLATLGIGIQFLEVTGLVLQDNPTMQALITPVQKVIPMPTGEPNAV